MPTTKFDVSSIKTSIGEKLLRYYGVSVAEATPQQLYRALATTVRDQVMQKWYISKNERRKTDFKMVYYMSIEFLVGRSLNCNLINLCATEEYRQALDELGIRICDVLPVEPEPGLGNGGLGRLAACYLESMATEGIPAIGSTLRYDLGFFKQRIVDGMQVELPDAWMASGNVWEVARPEETFTISFNGRVVESERDGRKVFDTVDAYQIDAIPYDMPVVGYDINNVNVLRTWTARPHDSGSLLSLHGGAYARALEEKNMAESITRSLYPNDHYWEGKMLRLKQHYFLASATIQCALHRFKRRYGNNFDSLPDHCVFQINDTHPGLAIPELMRLLIDQEGLGWVEASRIMHKCMAYTNHTVMAEALERWPSELIRTTLPRIYMILEELNRRECEQLFVSYPNQWDRIGDMAIIAYDQVHMANLCVSNCFSVNGVSQLHGKILQDDLFNDFYQIDKKKFGAITNGITHRRWLVSANPELTKLIKSAIGDGFIADAQQLEGLSAYQEDPAFLEQLGKVKQLNKERFADFVKKRQGVVIDPTFVFDTQAKRLHEYKRQLLNAIHIQVLFNRIVENPNFTMQPHLFIFGAKAAPSYVRAKNIIRFINELAKRISLHPRARDMLQILFLENYDVSSAEVLIPASEISQQLSTAGKEASGTGNMKFMMNGAVTLGTMDGANIEMYDHVGEDNIYIFGARADEVAGIYSTGNYHSIDVFERNPELRKSIASWLDGGFVPEDPSVMQDIYNSLFTNENGGMADSYLLLKDFGSYCYNFDQMMQDYDDRKKWLQMSLRNIACSGYFSSDRAVQEYNDKIWHCKKLGKS